MHTVVIFMFLHSSSLDLITKSTALKSDFKDRLIDIHRQEWQAYLNDNSKEYLEYQPSIVRANYINFLDCRQMRLALCLLKTNKLPLIAK